MIRPAALALLSLAIVTTGASPAAAQTTAGPGSGPTAAASHPLAAAIRYAENAARQADRVPGYSARMIRVSTQNGPTETLTSDLKLRTQPFSVYLKFAEPNAGREVLFIEGWNQNKLIAHEGSGPLSLVGTISLDPNSPRALKAGGRPITQSGIANLARGVSAEWQEALRGGIQPQEVRVQHYPQANLGPLAAEAVEVTLARAVTRTGQTKLRLFLDRATKLPVAMQAYGAAPTAGQPGPLLEEVRYLNLDTSRVPAASEFDPRNPAYDF